MTVVLPCLVLALLCLLRAGAEVPVQPDFTAKKMKDGMKSSIATISFTPAGELSMKLVWPLVDGCQKFELLFQQSGQSGHYVVREQDASPQLLQKFKELIPTVGLTKDMLVILPKSDQCTEAIR
ncbi:lipocalin-15-like [Grus japonensis]|uniref:Lipocalin-15-like n=1 Tax=Grus japonensis TaxID=30415 RepID=A0ABC9XKU7_GRUJA